MSQPEIVIGDRTSHGGTVITCSPETTINGKGVARMSDKVSCPKCKGVFPISQGDPSNIVDGHPVAYNGCKVSCGATLIASQTDTRTEPSGGAAPGAVSNVVADTLTNGFGDIGSGLTANYLDVALDDVGERFKGRFQVQDFKSGAPVASQSVRVRSTGGQYLTGTTDAEGFTQWVEHDAGEALAFDLTEPTP